MFSPGCVSIRLGPCQFAELNSVLDGPRNVVRTKEDALVIDIYTYTVYEFCSASLSLPPPVPIHNVNTAARFVL